MTRRGKKTMMGHFGIKDSAWGPKPAAPLTPEEKRMYGANRSLERRASALLTKAGLGPRQQRRKKKRRK